MSGGKLSFVAQFFLCGVFLCGRIGRAQTPDRILVFDSVITVDRDRTMHVAEKFEVANNTGFFDKGLHRRLRIKPVGPQRTRASSFQPIGAKIDGHEARLSTKVDGDVLDIEIATDTGTLPRGSYLIELSYTAKHQFAIYGNFEDLNQDISGEWPVPIEKATVAVSFAEGFPKEASVSADTGTSSIFQFDCLRTSWPSGVRFETTHSLSPGNRLFISARFPHPGYFVSDFKEDGLRAFLGNYPLLIPGLASIWGLILLTTAGVMVWRRGPKRRGSGLTVPADNALPNFWREVIRVYGFPIVMVVLAIVPGLNFTYSGHGGISWFFLPLCFPSVIVRILIKIAKGSEASGGWYKSFFKITIPSYIVVALPLSWAAATSIRMTLGLPISTWTFFALMVSPFPWWYFA